MTKYDERFKLEVVQRYLSGDKGYKALAREFGVGSTQVEQWVASYKRHGADGLRRKGHVKYSAQFKLEALERMQRENLSRTHMQALLDIRDAGAIARWERQYHEGGFAALLPRPKNLSAFLWARRLNSTLSTRLHKSLAEQDSKLVHR